MNQNNQTNGSQESHASNGVWFSIVGGLLLIVGLGLFIGSIWDDLPQVFQILVGFLAIGVAHGIGYASTRMGNYAYSGSILHVVGMALFPTVLNFIFDEYNVLPGNYAARVCIIATMGALTYIPFAWQSRRSIFVIFGISNLMFTLGALSYILFEKQFPIVPDYVYLLLGLLTVLITYSLKPVLYPVGFRVLSVVSVIGTAFYGFVMKDYIDFYFGTGVSFEEWFVWYPILAAVAIYIGKTIKSDLIKITGIVALVFAVVRILSEIDDVAVVYAILTIIGGWLVYVGFTTARKQKRAEN